MVPIIEKKIEGEEKGKKRITGIPVSGVTGGGGFPKCYERATGKIYFGVKKGIEEKWGKLQKQRSCWVSSAGKMWPGRRG